MMGTLTLRPALARDRDHLRRAVTELQEYERRIHATRLPGEEIADAYLDWLQRRSVADGILLVAEIDGAFAGFAAGWIEEEDNIAETADSNRFGLVSDVCVLPPFRGHRIAHQLLAALEKKFRLSGVTRMRIGALAANGSARASYERAGFSPYEVIFEKIISS